MYSLDDIKVTLLNKEEAKNFIFNHGRVACVCYDTDEKHAEKVGEKCLESGHTSGSRGDYFVFEIECPRFTADQIMRHEIGVFKNCQSQRYVVMDEFDCYVDPVILENRKLKSLYEASIETTQLCYKYIRIELERLGITGEAANDVMRTLLPIGVPTKLRIGFDIEALINLMGKRLCTRADAPAHRVAILMRKEVLAVEPRYAEYLVPQCKSKLYCPEHKGCGAYPSKKELQEIIKNYKKGE